MNHEDIVDVLNQLIENSRDGQYGFAAHYFAAGLNDTEFGFYFLNYHSRLPLLSGPAIPTSAPSSGRYFVEYPEGHRM